MNHFQNCYYCHFDIYFTMKFIPTFVWLFYITLQYEVLAYIFPLCLQEGKSCHMNVFEESEIPGTGLTVHSLLSDYAVCPAIFAFKYFSQQLIPKISLMLSARKTYQYRPPPSLFETMAIWTGAIGEDKTWETYKIFMLASITIFLLLFLYFGRNITSDIVYKDDLNPYNLKVSRSRSSTRRRRCCRCGLVE